TSLAWFLRLKQHEVSIATTLAEAVARAESPYDVLISDCDLRDGTGVELMARLQRRPRAAVALSGASGRDVALLSERAGFHEHLVKPVDPSRLLAAIARAWHGDSSGNGQPRRDVRATEGARRR